MSRVLACALLPLLVSACALDDVDPETSQAESDLSASQWHAPVAMNITARDTPSLAYWNNHLTMMVGGTWYTLDGSTWSTGEYTLNTSGGTSMVVFGGQLYAAFTQQAGLGICHYDSTQKTWLGCTWIPGYGHIPQLAVLGTNLYLSYLDRASDGTHDSVILDRVDVANHTVTQLWSRVFPAHIYSWGNALAAWSGQLHLVWEDGPGWSTPHPMHELVMVPNQYSVVSDLGMDADGTISMTLCYGTVHLIHAGDSDPTQTWWSYRPATSTGTWSPNVRLSQAGSNAVLGCDVFVQPTMIQTVGYDSYGNAKLGMSIFQ